MVVKTLESIELFSTMTENPMSIIAKVIGCLTIANIIKLLGLFNFSVPLLFTQRHLVIATLIAIKINAVYAKTEDIYLPYITGGYGPIVKTKPKTSIK